MTRYDQLVNSLGDPLSLFQMPGGQIHGFLDAGVKVGIELPFIGFVGAEFGITLIDKVILDLNGGDNNPPVLAHMAPNDPTTLVLNLGQYEAQRNYQINDTKEVFDVGHHSGSSQKGDESIDVTAYGVTQTFDHVKRVVAFGSNNDEIILFDSSLL